METRLTGQDIAMESNADDDDDFAPIAYLQAPNAEPERILQAREFDRLADAMFVAAKTCGVRIRWGADWNRNGVARERGETDSPHWEIVVG